MSKLINNLNLKISIITVSYNSEKTILDTFNSIRSQDYQNLEYIVIDGKSNDNTYKIINENLDIIDKLVCEEDKGIYDAMNKGIKLCSGDVIGILNSDDVYYEPTTISSIINNFKEDKDVSIVYGNINYVSKDLSKIVRKWKSSPFVENSFSKGWHPPHPAFFVKKKVYDEIGCYDLNFNIAADFDFMLRSLDVYKYDSKHLNKIITKMRVGGESNRSISNILKGNKQVIESFKKYKIKISACYIFYRILPKFLEFLRIN